MSDPIIHSIESLKSYGSHNLDQSALQKPFHAGSSYRGTGGLHFRAKSTPGFLMDSMKHRINSKALTEPEKVAVMGEKMDALQWTEILKESLKSIWDKSEGLDDEDEESEEAYGDYGNSMLEYVVPSTLGEAMASSVPLGFTKAVSIQKMRLEERSK